MTAYINDHENGIQRVFTGENGGKYLYDFNNKLKHCYISDDDFILNFTPYERDESNGRCYFLEESTSLTSKAGREGGLVRRRVSKADYEHALALMKRIFAKSGTEEPPKEPVLFSELALDKAVLALDIQSGDATPECNFLPSISAEDMENDFASEVVEQYNDPYIPISIKEAVSLINGYHCALQDLGMVEGKHQMNLQKIFGVRQDAPLGAEPHSPLTQNCANACPFSGKDDIVPTLIKMAEEMSGYATAQRSNPAATQEDADKAPPNEPILGVDYCEIRIEYSDYDMQDAKVFINGKVLEDLTAFSIDMRHRPYIYRTETSFPIPEKHRTLYRPPDAAP